MTQFTIRQVDPDDYADEIHAMHKVTFSNGSAPKPELDTGTWWIAFTKDGHPAAFAAVSPSQGEEHAVYLYRCGVLPEYWGHGLQLRLIRIREKWARAHGYKVARTETTDTVYSANNLIRAGYRLFDPKVRWGFAQSLYWRKDLGAPE